MARRSWGGWRGGACGWGRGPLAVVGVEVPAVGAVGEAVRGSQADCNDTLLVDVFSL